MNVRLKIRYTNRETEDDIIPVLALTIDGNGRTQTEVLLDRGDSTAVDHLVLASALRELAGKLESILPG